MTLGARRLIQLCIAHGLDPSVIWNMTIVEFVTAIEAAKRRKAN